MRRAMYVSLSSSAKLLQALLAALGSAAAGMVLVSVIELIHRIASIPLSSFAMSIRLQR